MESASNNCTLYHQTKTSIGFLSRQELNSRYFIQPSKTLLFELIRYTLIIYRGICRTPYFFLNDLYLHSRKHITQFYCLKKKKNLLDIILFVHEIEMELQHYGHEHPLHFNKVKGIGLLCSMVRGGGFVPRMSLLETPRNVS